jgi:anthranilate synthase/aminodeoxychorismate synthase-like glutamine amidotransferase
MVLVIDNYDSFTYNLVQLLGKLLLGSNEELRVERNDAISLSDIASMDPRRILLSPGPGRPENAGVTVEVVKTFGAQTPILGVCLGCQAIGLAFGGTIVHAPTLMHGRTSEIVHDNTPLFRNVGNPFTATRYHSLVISPRHFPGQLRVTAKTADGVIMAVQHTSFPITGVQFHPESILTVEGERIMRNWITM